MGELRIAVVGSGIGGLVFCVAFGQRSDAQVDLYEATPKLGEIGAGIGVWYRTWKMMEKLGIDKDLAQLEKEAPQNEPRVSFRYRKADQPEGVSYYDMVTTGGLLSLHRAGVQQVLLKNLPKSCKQYFSKKLASYENLASGAVLLHFEDGSTAEYDILVGADGIKSAVRQTFLADLVKAGKLSPDEASSLKPSWSGSVAYRGIIPRDVLEKRIPDHRALRDRILYVGKNKHLIVFPIARGEKINVVAFSSDPKAEGTSFGKPSDPWVTNVSKADLLNEYSGWEAEVTALLECIDQPSRWAIHALTPLSTFVTDRVAITGDAAHAMTPHLGSGAGQAIEDTYILSALLSSPKCTKETLPEILQIYDQVRRPLANRVMELSRSVGLLFELNGPTHGDVEPHGEVSLDRLKDMGRDCTSQWEWAWTTFGDEDLDRALGMLENIRE